MQFVFLGVEDAAAVGEDVGVAVQAVTAELLTLFAWRPMQHVKY